MAEEPMGTRRNVADALREKRERRKKAAAVAAEEIPGVTPATSSTPKSKSSRSRARREAASVDTARPTDAKRAADKARRRRDRQRAKEDAAPFVPDHTEAWAELAQLKPEDTIAVDEDGQPLDQHALGGQRRTPDDEAPAGRRPRRGRKLDATTLFIEEESGFKQVTKDKLDRQIKRREVAAQRTKNDGYRIPFDKWLDVVCSTVLSLTPGFASGWLLCSVYLLGLLSTAATQDHFTPVAPVFGAVVFVFGGLALTYALDRYETRNIVSGEYFNHWWMLLAVAFFLVAQVITLVQAGNDVRLAYARVDATTPAASLDDWKTLNIVRAALTLLGWVCLSMDGYSEIASDLLQRNRVVRFGSDTSLGASSS